MLASPTAFALKSEAVCMASSRSLAELNTFFTFWSAGTVSTVCAQVVRLKSKAGSSAKENANRRSCRTMMLFVTLHGGKPERDPHKNNVHAYDKDGNRITSSVLDESEDVILNELRAAYLVGKYLYVANANKTQNSVLCYEGSGTQYRFVSRFASAQTCKGILHPFDFTFDGLGFCYLSSQDTNVVTRLIVSDDGRIGRSAPVAAALPASGKFLAGTFVASSNSNLSKPATTPVASPTGLSYSDVEAKKHSVRGVVWANGRLYVADQPAGTVKV